ncbi:MAG: RsmE family RNA methyltransferase [Rubripirellula sp.]
MTRRYFVSNLPENGGLVALSTAEAQHATRVMRVQVGDTLTLFDGGGNEAEATFVAVGRNECQCEAEPQRRVDREPSTEIHLGIALPKPDRARELIERLTEIGVKSVTPLVAARTQRPPSDSLLQKLSRGVIEACKQSGRNQLLTLHAPVSASSFFETARSDHRWIAHSSGSAIATRQDSAGSVVAVVGPEGGWTDEEFQLAVDLGYTPIDLGRRIYRIETAATVIASVLAN